MTLGILLGCLLGLALVLLALAIWPPRPSLAQSMTRWERERSRQVSVIDGPIEDQLSQRFGRRLVAEFARRGFTFDKLRANLELLERPVESHMVRKSIFALIGLLLPTVLATFTYAATGSVPSFTVPAIVGVMAAVVLFIVPDLTIAQKADDRRRDLRRALAVFFTQVHMSMSGGRGVPEALQSTSRIFSGWSFELLRNTIEEARYGGETPWAALTALGERTAVRDLTELGGALTLVAQDGSKVKETLAARAETLRRRQLAEEQGAAAKADQSMQIAQVVLAVAFFIFIGFPALYAVLAI
ncbi:MAG: type II secretion system F family protein [Propionibacteriales bacterium]|nr:type II secretion system F family protein [Propionibacteriales bacterium]